MKRLLSFIVIICAAMLAAFNVGAATYDGVDIYHGTSENGQIDYTTRRKR